jgi:glycosyltransferase involved in cell wall biosynthesis
MNPTEELQAELGSAAQMLRAANYPQAELHLRRYLRSGGAMGRAQSLLQAVTRAYGMSDNFKLTETNVVAGSAPRFLLIKAWGYGFWSDVHHVLGQLLLAELTQRTPIVHWGTNSLFGDGSGTDAFCLYFEPVNSLELAQLPQQLSIYPPKWTRENLAEENVNKWDGQYSRNAAQFSFQRDEDLVVSDFYMTLSSLIPWIAPESKYYGKSDDELYADLFARYLKPLPGIEARVDDFYLQHMAQRHWVAVHARGSDKVIESANLHKTNLLYFSFIDRIIELNPEIGVFLLTDAVDIHSEFSARYGERLITTPALRSDSTTGVHMQGHAGTTVGEEVLVDALLAARCDYFVGNQESNVSMAIASLKHWPQGLMVILGEKNIRADNFYLHRSAKVDVQEVAMCRLCKAPVQQVFDKLVLGRHRVGYHQCTGCGALQTDTPHWLDEAYASRAEWYDTGKATRTVVNFLALPKLFEILGVRKSDLAVDFGGGTGLLARLLRDVGYNFHTCDKFGSSEFMGAYVWPDMGHPCRLVTLFEVAEHFADPGAEWQRLFDCNSDWILGSTGLYNGQGADWSYLSEASGQHVFFYSQQALAYLGKQSGRFVYVFGMYFLISRQPLSSDTLTAINDWRADMYPACKGSFDSWASAPYAFAVQDNAEVVTYSGLRQSGKRIAIDGMFFRYASGAARLWKSLLAQWSASSFAQSLVVIDRDHTAPRWPGITYVDAPQYDYAQMAYDRALLESICEREDIGLFISTYYTIPLSTPSALLVLDMIPEIMGFDVTNPQWVGKRRAIEYAQAYLSISHSTERDLVRLYPATGSKPKGVTHCGCDFHTAPTVEVTAFREKFAIERPYFMISGAHGGQKNGELFFKAFALLGDARSNYAVVCTNAVPPLADSLAVHLGGAQLHMLILSDEELQCAYSGALALSYPSRYEVFGLPVLEGMACSCPVITTRTSSLPEVGGDAVIYVDPDSVDEMHQALLDVQNASTRADLIARGLRQAELFSWSRMAREVGQRLAQWAVEFAPH